MRIISIKKLKDFWLKHPECEQPLKAWYAEVKKCVWKKPGDSIKSFGTASILPNNRIVFNIKGNDYRIVVAVTYNFTILYIRFIGTHAEYDRINAKEI